MNLSLFNQRRKISRLPFCLPVLFICILCIPLLNKKQECQAAGFQTEKYKGTVKAGKKITKLYDRVYIDEGGNLVLETSCDSGNNLLFGFNTKALCFRLTESGGKPHQIMGPYLDFPLSESNHLETYDVETKKACDTYVLPMEAIVSWLLQKTGLSKDDLMNPEGISLYVNNIFSIKYRDKENQPFQYVGTYDTLSEIRNASLEYKKSREGKGWYEFSETVKQNFSAYFDAELSITFATSTVEVRSVYTESSGKLDGNEIVQTEMGETKFLSGSIFKYHAEDYIEKTSKKYIFAGSALVSNESILLPTQYTGTSEIAERLSADTQVLYLLYKEEKKDPPINPPTVTSTVTPTVTPTAVPTQKPEIQADGGQLMREERYFTSDRGYTLQRVIRNQEYSLAFSIGGIKLSDSAFTAFSKEYCIGFDTDLNSWYFVINGEAAEYVHPRAFNGISVETDIEKLFEIEFPEQLSYNGRMYKVESIGGYGARYHENKAHYNSDQWGATVQSVSYGKERGSFFQSSYTVSVSAFNGSTQNQLYAAEYLMGIAGTGFLLSSDTYQQSSWSQSFSKSFVKENYQNYYVYNTTLERVRIPDTVVRILPGAFYGCQCLQYVEGGENLVEIDDYAFAGAEKIVSELSFLSQEENKYIRSNFFYNESKSENQKTDIMLRFDEKASLKEKMHFPAKEQWHHLERIGTYAFSYHRNLVDVQLSESVREVFDFAFAYSNLLDIHIEGDSTSIAEGAFQTLGTGSAGKNRVREDRTVVYASSISKVNRYVEKYPDYYVLAPIKSPEKEVMYTLRLEGKQDISVFSDMYEVKRAIPSTEQVNILGNLNNFRLQCEVKKRTGLQRVRLYVTVPYQVAGNEKNPEKEPLYQTVIFEKDLPYSYFEIIKGGLFFPKKITLSSDAFWSHCVEVDLKEETPEFQIKRYLTKMDHLLFSAFDEDGTPVIHLRKDQTLTVSVEDIGRKAELEKKVKRDAREFLEEIPLFCTVRSDSLKINGLDILSDAFSKEKGLEPDINQLEEVRKQISGVTQILSGRIGVDIFNKVPNGCYPVNIEVSYRANAENIDPDVTYTELLPEKEFLMIHTPVVCNSLMQSLQESERQCELQTEEGVPLFLSEDGEKSRFFVKIKNEGKHNDEEGYGERDYAAYVSFYEESRRNEVRFPVDVIVDVKNDGKKENDQLLPAGEWMILSERGQIFYLPETTEEGSYLALFRTIAINGEDFITRTENNANLSLQNYTAIDTKRFQVVGRVSDFCVTELEGESYHFSEEELASFPICIGINAKSRAEKVNYSLPLRKGIFKKQQNLGELNAKDTFRFQLFSYGSSFFQNSILTLTPEFSVLENGVYKKVDVYINTSTGENMLLEKWEEDMHILKLNSESSAKQVSAVGMQWQGKFTLPDQKYFVTEGVNLKEIMKTRGFSEDDKFIRNKETIVLRFRIKLKREDGKEFFYGLSNYPEYCKVWLSEAGSLVREDSTSVKLPINGGEVAVISSCPEKYFSTHGIY